MKYVISVIDSGKPKIRHTIPPSCTNWRITAMADIGGGFLAFRHGQFCDGWHRNAILGYGYECIIGKVGSAPTVKCGEMGTSCLNCIGRVWRRFIATSIRILDLMDSRFIETIESMRRKF